MDPTSEQGRLRLTSFVWPFDVHRHDSAGRCLGLAAAHPPVVDRASAAAWLTAQLAARPADPSTLTVIWHSVTQLYWPVAEIAAVRAALSGYGRDHRVGEVGMEYVPDDAAGEEAGGAHHPLVGRRLDRRGTVCSGLPTTTGSRFG